MIVEAKSFYSQISSLIIFYNNVLVLYTENTSWTIDVGWAINLASDMIMHAPSVYLHIHAIGKKADPLYWYTFHGPFINTDQL